MAKKKNNEDWKKNADQFCDKLENNELNAQYGLLPDCYYAELLATYLYKNELSHAQFLWRRIPSKIKRDNEEFDLLWKMFQHLWNNELVEFHKINYEWPKNLKKIIKALQERVYDETIKLIGLAYTSIFENRFCEMLNCTPEQLTKICKELNWEIQDGTYPRLIIPKQPEIANDTITSSEDQLAKLTDFVTFLEN